jgi:putative isomerase
MSSLLAYLDDPTKFGGRFILPGTSRDDPAYSDNTYWRGRIWPPLNYLVWHGLRRSGLHDRASDLATKSFDLFRQAWEGRRLCPENFNAETGEPLDQPDTDGFYNWGALMPLMAVGEVMDISPWGGWELVNHGEDLTLGPVQSPVGAVTVDVSNGILRLTQSERSLLATDIVGRLSHLSFGDNFIELDLPEKVADGSRIWLPAVHPDSIVTARLGAADMPWGIDGDATLMTFSAKDGGRRLHITFDA